MKVSRLIKIFIPIVFLFFILLFMEIGASFLIKDKTPLERILNILEEDSTLFWRQKSGLNVIFEGVNVRTNRMGLRGSEITTPKQKNILRIVCLGASPTFGWGVKEEETYAYRLNELLIQKFPHRRIEVINGGVVGYSSYQGLKFLQNEILAVDPNIITVPYVINDVDKHRFFRSDGQRDSLLADRSQIAVDIDNLLNRSNFFKAYRKFLLKVIASKRSQYFGQNAGNKYFNERRVSDREYEANLREIVDLARKKNIKVVFIKMPVNLPPAPDISRELLKTERQFIDSALVLFKQGEYKRAIEKLEKAVLLNPYSSEAYYYLGNAYEKMGDVVKAEDNFLQSKKRELNECGRLAKKYNKIMDIIAYEEKVALVDIASEFEEYNKQYKNSLFQNDKGDIIHPNKDGHRLIGDALFTVIYNDLLSN